MSNNTTTVSLITNPDSMAAIFQFASTMAEGRVTVPDHLRGSVADCMAITMQSAQWQMNPFAVAQKTHLVNGVLGYEAQLINAVVKSSGAIVGRFHYEYFGDWSKHRVIPEKYEQNGKTKWKHRYENEGGLGIRVGAIPAGETDIVWSEPLMIQGIKIRNSPVWQSNPRQQIAYLAVKQWARLYCPEVILGVYSNDELEDSEPAEERDVTPQREPDALDSLLEQSGPEAAKEEPQHSAPLFEQLMDKMANATDLEQLGAARDATGKAGDKLSDEQKMQLQDAMKKSKQRIINEGF